MRMLPVHCDWCGEELTRDEWFPCQPDEEGINCGGSFCQEHREHRLHGNALEQAAMRRGLKQYSCECVGIDLGDTIILLDSCSSEEEACFVVLDERTCPSKFHELKHRHAERVPANSPDALDMWAKIAWLVRDGYRYREMRGILRRLLVEGH